MHKALEQFFDHHAANTSGQCVAAKSQIVPILEATNSIERYLLELSHRLSVAKATADDGGTVTTARHVQIQIDTTRRLAGDCAAKLDELASALLTLESQIDRGKSDMLNAMLGRAGQATAAAKA